MSSYNSCEVQRKFSEAALHELTTDIATEAERLVEPKHLWKGRHAKLADGSTFMMPDTPTNQAAYPPNPAQKTGIGFPIARFVVVIAPAPHAGKAGHPESIRVNRQEERRQAADRKRTRRARRRLHK